jgi:3-hydroxyisobutyrate dehydrogenase-like beta-hydroxyacid dehydrogenase
MGQNLARNVARHGFPVAVHNRTAARTHELLERHGGDGPKVGPFSAEELAGALRRPRRILVMVKAGPTGRAASTPAGARTTRRLRSEPRRPFGRTSGGQPAVRTAVKEDR